MSTTLFEAPPYDPRRERRRRFVLLAAILVLTLAAVLAYRYRNWPEERVVSRFFSAVQHRDFEQAYAIWMHDPEWKQHPEHYARYPFNEFYRDWGPGGEWGLINSFEIDGAQSPRGGGSGVVVVVTVNNRAERARIWVEKSDKTLTFSPY